MLGNKFILHIGDMASTSTHLVTAANARGLNWKTLQLAETTTFRGTWLAGLEKLARGVTWEAQLLGNKLLRPQVHLHGATALPYVKWALGKEYALHLHGTDIRTRLYQERYRSTVLAAVADAAVVFYSTPDLAEHILPLRPDARLVPVPISLDSAHDPRPTYLNAVKDYIFFTSRWEEIKGGKTQLELARLIRNKLPSHISLVGLDWGKNAPQAAQLGVKLISKLSNREFRAALHNARLCIGQTAGIISASELESLAEGTPLVIPLNKEWYSGSDSSLQNIPVIGGATVECTSAAALSELVLENLEAILPPHTQHWLADNHSPQAALKQVLAGYAATR